MRARWLAVVVGAAGCGKDASPAKPAPHPIDVAVTDANTAVVMSDGAVLVWGHARRGAVGWLDRRDVAVPVRAEMPPATEIAAGGFNRSSTFCARGGADWWCWGDTGALPLGGIVRWEGFSGGGQPERVAGFAGLQQIRFGGANTTSNGCAITAGDTLVCWRSQWSKPFAAPGPVAAVEIGDQHACALAKDGRVWCWGVRTSGAVDGTVAPEPMVAYEPVVVPDVSDATQLAVGWNTSCARTRNDEVACWGVTFYGKGVVRFAGVPGGKLFSSVAKVCELAPDGRVRCLDQDPLYWCPSGIDRKGQPCTPGITPHPPDAPPLRWIESSPAKKVAWGREHACAITTDDTLECSGRNDHGEIGDATLIDRPVPIAVDLSVRTTTPPEPDAPEHARRAMRWDQAPPGCAHDAALAGTPRSLPVVSAWASADASLIVLRDYASSVSDDDLRGDQRELKIHLTLPVPFSTGTIAFGLPYDDLHNPVPRKEPSVMAVLRASDGDVAWFDRTGSLTISVHDDRWVCGSIEAIGSIAGVQGAATLRGKFAAEVAP